VEGWDINQIDVLGERINDVKIPDFRFPDYLLPISFELYRSLKILVRNFCSKL